jgi:predicted deacetylase
MLIILFFSFFDLWFARRVLPRQIDDFSDSILCEEEYLEKSSILMVIPLFENKSIAENKTWCKYVLSLNKTLGMHGVYHTYQEFLVENRSEDYIRLGMQEFYKCFGFYPEIFGVPHLALKSENKKTLQKMGFKIHNKPFYVFHKVYHCEEKGKFSFKILDYDINNRVVDWI